MDNESASVPFTIPKAFGGFAECHGVLHASPTGLHLEFESRDSFVGVLKSRVRERAIAWEELADLKLQAGWFSTRLLLTTNTLRALHGLPGTEACHVCLVVNRRHREAARQLAFTVNLRLCERELHRAAREAPGRLDPSA